MSRLILCGALALLTFAAPAPAAASDIATSRKFGLGGVLGDPTGVTIKYFFKPQHAIDASIGIGWWAGPSIVIQADYQFHHLVKRAPTFDLRFYVGAGPKLTFWFRPGCHFMLAYSRRIICTRADESIAGFALRMPLGLAFHLNRTPLEIFLEAGLGFGIVPYFGILIDGGVGIRYYF